MQPGVMKLEAWMRREAVKLTLDAEGVQGATNRGEQVRDGVVQIGGQRRELDQLATVGGSQNLAVTCSRLLFSFSFLALG